MMSHAKKVKKGQRTARLVLPNGYPYAQLYASQYLLQQFHKNQNDFSKRQNFEKYEDNLGQSNNNIELFKYDLNDIGISCSNNYNNNNNSNSIIKEKKLSDKNNDLPLTYVSTLETLQNEHVPKFFNIKGKGSLPTILFVNGKVVLS